MSCSGSAVYTRLVSKEVAVDGKSSLNRTVGLNFSLNLGDVCRKFVSAGPLMEVFSVGGGIIFYAGSIAFRCGGVFQSRAIAWGKRVRLAIVTGVVEPSSNDTGGLEVVPGRIEESSVASIFCSIFSSGDTGGTASQQVLSGNSGLDLLFTGNTDTVAHNSDSSDGPVRTASTLIMNIFDGVAFGPGKT